MTQLTRRQYKCLSSVGSKETKGVWGELLLLVVEEKFSEIAGPLSIEEISKGEGDG